MLSLSVCVSDLYYPQTWCELAVVSSGFINSCLQLGPDVPEREEQFISHLIKSEKH